MSLKHATLFLAFWLALAAHLQAQRSSPKHRQKNATPASDTLKFVDIGIAFQAFAYDFKDMNAALKKVGFPGLKSTVPGFSLSRRIRLGNGNRWLDEYALEHAKSSASSFTPNRADGRDVSFSDWALTNRLLYNLFPQIRRTRLYPLGGVGIHYKRLRLYEGLPKANSLGQAIANNVRRITLSEFPVSAELGLSLEQTIIASRTEISLACRSGVVGMLATNWRIDGDYRVNLPLPGIATAYFNIGARVRQYQPPKGKIKPGK